ncbi:PLDc N-terminal domain-containing protein [Microbacterium sp. NPDC091382]|uniref:PLDc N-terminal domain-containing protein n=1 Tax=Microbacterium sp. NPDC091382 TaxID=3364210 RepID=UPI0037FF9DB5
MDTVNPLIPAADDIAWSIVALVLTVLAIVALVSLALSARRLTSTQALVWVLVVLLIPVAGPVAWLAVGRRARMPRREA